MGKGTTPRHVGDLVFLGVEIFKKAFRGLDHRSIIVQPCGNLEQLASGQFFDGVFDLRGRTHQAKNSVFSVVGQALGNPPLGQIRSRHLALFAIVRLAVSAQIRSANVLPSSNFHLQNGFVVSTSPFDPKVAKNEQIHFGAQEAIESFFGVADHRFVFVEGRVEDERDAR